jgi:hypothetical protein
VIPENVTRHIIPTIFVWLQNFQEIAYGEFFGGGLHRHFPTVAFAQVANRSLRGLVSHAEREHGIRHAQRQSRILVHLHAIPEEQRRAVESVERLVFGPKWTQVAELNQSTSGSVN